MSRPVQALLSLIAISICGPLVSSARAEERPNVIPTALPLEFIPQQIDVPEGFSIELVAGPPLVEHPTFATFDDHGKLYVCNNAGVNLSADDLEAQLPNSINLLEDTDGDGKFDKSTVFA
ncbi:MAG: hypothetical protein HOH50_13435, partial [Planctomycetaceae bacterium]|nr:hypothetical protein [Planctomycetaceae bacterium]